MLVDSSGLAAGSTVAGAIRQASQATGTSFDYLLATAQVESGLDPRAGASTSSARGLFQFIEQTWLATMKQSGPALGYGNYAAAITKTASGQYQVQNPALRSEILKLRNDPTVNAVMAGAFTSANAAALSQRLGRAPSEGELYIAHFLGPGGAARLITLAANNPSAQAADFFSTAAHANSSIFYDRSTGAPRSLAQVRDILTARYEVARRSTGGSRAVAQAEIPAAPVSAVSMPNAPAESAAAAAAVPDTAGMTSAYAAAVPPPAAHATEMFHGLFQDPDRSSPVATAVSALWGIANATPDTADPSAPTPARGGLLDLFKDPVERS